MNSMKGMKWAGFERFSLYMRASEARACSHQGQCDDDVAEVLKAPHIVAQLDAIPADKVRAELREYGAWDDAELADDAQNRARILWIAAGNIRDELAA